jgi:hypothetical protein
MRSRLHTALFLIALMFAGAMVNVLKAQSAASPEVRFEQRRQRLLDVVSQERDRGFFTVTAKFVTGRDKEWALAMLDSLTTDESIGGMFYSYTAIGTYL